MKRAVYKAIIYREKADGRGNVSLEKVTTCNWVTVTQIAASLGVAPQTMYRAIIDENVMPYYRVKSQIRVTPEDFAAYLESCRGAEYERPNAK